MGLLSWPDLTGEGGSIEVGGLIELARSYWEGGSIEVGWAY